MKPVFYILFTIVSAKLNGEGNLCGRPLGAFRQDRIVAGYDVGYYRYSWYTALMSGNVVACGGSLIGSKAILTAAHCFKEYMGQDNKNNSLKLENAYSVILGVYNKCQKEKTQRTFAVEKVHIHEKYKDYGPYYDIALLVLKENADSYQPICLPKDLIKVRPREGTVPGLGTIKYHGPTPCTLQEARLLIYSDDECRKMMNRTGSDPKKVYGAFCAGYLQGGIDTCQGDSGGPLQIMDEFGNYILFGIVSFGFHCANPGMLGMYTDVSNYISWIEEKAGFKASIEGLNFTTTENTINTNEESDTETQTPTHHKRHFHIYEDTDNAINIFILRKNKALVNRKNKSKTNKVKRPQDRRV